MIYIVRHGQTDWNVSKQLQGHQPITLNEKGRTEAEIVANEIEKLDFTKIISSDLVRAKETAEIINRKIRKELILDARLRSVDYGNLEGRLISDITQDEWKAYNSTPEKFGAESVISVYIRIKNLFDELIKKNQNVLIVAHGGSLRLISYYLKYRETFNNEIYCKFYKDAKQPTNTALFKWNTTLTELEPIYY